MKFGIITLLNVGINFAQTVNIGELVILPNTQFSTVFDFENKPQGDFLNDGNFYAYANFKNDGLTTYSDLSNGFLFFIGNKQQLIGGEAISGFQNVEFNNASDKKPFHLETIIAVNKEAVFKNGIVDCSNGIGKIIFNENAFHSETSNLSFVDGRVEKIGSEKFEFPVGDDVYYRPSLNEVNKEANGIYTTEYFFESIGNIYPYDKKEEGIIAIDQVEYWNFNRNKGTDKSVLSLTLDNNTTPAAFFEEDAFTELAIVRWDTSTSKWLNEKGIVTDHLTGADYTKLITTQVSDYGIFTIAIVKKENPEPPSDDDVTIYNAISPNGDGINDSFYIKGISNYPDNTVEIYNRWGVKVYDAKSYNESNVMFKGYSDGRDTVNRSAGLPSGTYFYILKYKKEKKTIKKMGYLFISNDK